MLVLMSAISASCTANKSEKTAEEKIIGTWRADASDVTYFIQDGTGRTEFGEDVYEFTWEMTSVNDAFERRREFSVFEYMKILYASAEERGILWGMDPQTIAPDEWSGEGYILALTFDGIDHLFDFAFNFDGADSFIINAGHLGQTLSPKSNFSERFEWITFTRDE